MSDSVSNLDDVEDVLSSIRRLVSETADPTRPPVDDAAEEPDQPAAPAQPALVLTSAQRIDQPAKTPAADAEHGTDALVATEEGQGAGGQSAEMAEGDAAQPETAQPEATRPDMDQSDMEDVAGEIDVKPVMLDSLRRAVSGAFEEEQRAFVAEPEDAPDSSSHTPDNAETGRPEALAATWPVRPPEDYYEDEADKEPAVVKDWLIDGQTDAEPQLDETTETEADASGDDPADEGEAAAWFDPALDPGSEAASEVVPETAQIHHFDPQMTVVETGWTDEGEIIDASEIVAVDPASEDEMEYEGAELQAAEADDADSPPGIEAFLEGDPTETVVENGIEDAEIADDDATEDAGEITDAPAASHQDADPEDGVSMFAAGHDAADEDAGPSEDLADLDDATLIDEEALRDMVSEIVRQELTGEMGERITRNVRKLVRREIHRALMTREFD